MTIDLIEDKYLDHKLNFEKLPSIYSLVEETFTDTEQSPSNKVYKENGELNATFLLKNTQILLAANDWASAKPIFESLIQHGEYLGAAYAGLGVCLELAGSLDSAVLAYKEAVIYEPSYIPLIALADLLIRKKNNKEAISALLRSSHLPKIKKEELFKIQKLLGNCYLRENLLDHAEKHYKQAYDLCPNSDTIHVSIGCLAIQKKQGNLANQQFNNALKINENNISAHIGLGLTHLMREEKMMAHDSFAHALEIENTTPMALYYLVKCAYELSSYDKAIEMLSQFIVKNPVNSNMLFSLSGLYFHKKDFVNSKKHCLELLRLKPEHEGCRKLLEKLESMN